MSENLATLQVADGVGELVMNNPPLNLLSIELREEMLSLIDEAAARADLRVLIITGTGEKAFCAGSDIKEFPELMKPEGNVLQKKLRPENVMYSRLADFPLPTIAALNGSALGGGLELAVCCDMLVAEDGTRLGLPEVRLGVFPGSGGTVRVTRLIGEGRAKQMMFTGDLLDASTANSWGLVNMVVKPGYAVEKARELAARIARNHAEPLRLCKRAVDFSFDMDEQAAVTNMLPLIEQAFHGPAIREGVRAFFAKEEPDFTLSSRER